MTSLDAVAYQGGMMGVWSQGFSFYVDDCSDLPPLQSTMAMAWVSTHAIAIVQYAICAYEAQGPDLS